MRKLTPYYLLFCTVCLLGSCQPEVVFEPARGTVNGKLKDNNGKLLEGITVHGTYQVFTDTEQNSITKSTQTGSKGAYMLDDLWGQVELSVQTPRFMDARQVVDLNLNEMPLVNFTLIGSPTIQKIDLNKNDLSDAASDSIFVRIEAIDSFNTVSFPYQGYILVRDEQAETETVFPAYELFREEKTVVVSGHILGDELEAGTYDVVVELYDPDGNKHEMRSAQTIEK